MYTESPSNKYTNYGKYKRRKSPTLYSPFVQRVICKQLLFQQRNSILLGCQRRRVSVKQDKINTTYGVFCDSWLVDLQSPGDLV